MQAAIVEIEVMCDRLESAVKVCRRRLKELALGACSDVKEAVNEGKTVLLQRRGKMTTHKGVIQRADEMKTVDIVSGMTSAMQTRVNDLACSTVLPADAKVISTVTLVIDPEAVSRVERELKELGQLKVVPADVIAQRKLQPTELPAVAFHRNHGTDIVLSNNQHTAERTSYYGNGVVISRDPMQVSMLHEVVIDLIHSRHSYSDYLGVVTKSPDTITLPPSWSNDLKCAVVLRDSWVSVNGKQTDRRVGAPLRDVREGGRVGLALDRSRYLHLYVNGKHIGVVAPGVADPCYFMIDIRYLWKKVTAQPVKHVKMD